MTCKVLDFGASVELLLGGDAEAERVRRIQVLRVAAFRRAHEGKYWPSDRGLFGSADGLMRAGPSRDPRLGHAPKPPTPPDFR